MLRRLLLWSLLVGLTPAGPELVESLVHFVREGDFVHATDARHTPPAVPQEEHGCSVLCHACRCHGPTSPSRSLPRQPQMEPGHRMASAVDSRRVSPQATPEPQDPPPIT